MTQVSWAELRRQPSCLRKLQVLCEFCIEVLVMMARRSLCVLRTKPCNIVVHQELNNFSSLSVILLKNRIPEELYFY